MMQRIDWMFANIRILSGTVFVNVDAINMIFARLQSKLHKVEQLNRLLHSTGKDV